MLLIYYSLCKYIFTEQDYPSLSLFGLGPTLVEGPVGWVLARAYALSHTELLNSFSKLGSCKEGEGNPSGSTHNLLNTVDKAFQEEQRGFVKPLPQYIKVLYSLFRTRSLTSYT